MSYCFLLNYGFIELKNTDDSFASAANYLNKLGWSNNKPCFYSVELKDTIPENMIILEKKEKIIIITMTIIKKMIISLKGNFID